MKYFILGSDGMMGKYFCSVAKDRELVPFTRNDYDIVSNNYESLKGCFEDYNIQFGDIILNFAGAIKQRNFSLKDYVLINSLFPHQLQDISDTFGVRLIHLTTDCVYSGDNGNYIEDDPPDCVDWYGSSKSLGEPGDSCCIRTSIVGFGSANNASLFDWFLNEKAENLKGFTNHIWNGVTCLELSNYILKIIDKDILWSGVRHVHSNSVSKYELLSTLNKTFDLNKNIHESVSDFNCDRSLLSKYTNPISINSIENQISLLKEFHDGNI